MKEGKVKKPFYKRWWFVVIVIIVVIGFLGDLGDDTKETNTTSTSDTVKEEVKQETPEEKQLREETEAKEQEELRIATQAKWDSYVSENTKILSAGTHTVPDQLAAGVYDITFNNSGNFVINSKDGSLMTNEIGGSYGISKYRAVLLDGDKIDLSGVSINTLPTKSELKPYETIELYAGYWFVGKDVTKGRYKVTVGSGSGNFVIYGDNGSLKTNEILGSEYGVSEVVVELKDGDIITISSLQNVSFTPES